MTLHNLSRRWANPSKISTLLRLLLLVDRDTRLFPRLRLGTLLAVAHFVYRASLWILGYILQRGRSPFPPHNTNPSPNQLVRLATQCATNGSPSELAPSNSLQIGYPSRRRQFFPIQLRPNSVTSSTTIPSSSRSRILPFHDKLGMSFP